MWELGHKESWVPKNRCFELWCCRRLLRLPWTARRSNHSILKEISPECSLEGLMLKLKLQYFGYVMQRTDSFEKTLMLRTIEGRRRRGWQRMRWLDGITVTWTWVWASSGTYDGQGSLVCFSPWSHKESDTTEWLDWMTQGAGRCKVLFHGQGMVEVFFFFSFKVGMCINKIVHSSLERRCWGHSEQQRT